MIPGTIRAATLFSGIGAPEVAMPDWEWLWHAEIEAFPSAVLRARRPHSQNLGDVNAADFIERAERIGRPDVIVFGSPCQDFSVAGGRVGLDGDRGNMALVGLGIVARLRPSWFLFENVPGLLSSYSGSAEAERSLRARAAGGEAGIGTRADFEEDSDFAAFLSLVQQCGYLGCYRITDAQFAGVPQRRRRVFFVGYLGDWRPAAAVLLEPDSLRGDHPPRREAREGLAETVTSSLARCSADEAERDTLVVPPLNAGMGKRRGSGAHGDALVAGAVSSKWPNGTGGPAGDECYNLISAAPIGFNARQDPDAWNDRTGPLDTDGGTQAIAFQTRGSNVDVERVSGTIGTNADRASGSAPMVFQSRIARNGRGQPEDVVPALNGADADATSDMRPIIATERAVRRLTPRECERLQGFPDDFTLITRHGRPAADAARYKALGNAMNVQEVRWILKRIEMFEATQKLKMEAAE